MKKILALCLLLLPTVAQADVIIGFRGKDGAFDQQAFSRFADKRGKPGVILYADQIDAALSHIEKHQRYELYGYSLGASSVVKVMRKVKHMPEHIWTVGAFHSTNVNFTSYGVRFDNFFDASGTGTKSPGMHIGVSHGKIMQFVSDNFGD